LHLLSSMSYPRPYSCAPHDTRHPTTRSFYPLFSNKYPPNSILLLPARSPVLITALLKTPHDTIPPRGVGSLVVDLHLSISPPPRPPLTYPICPPRSGGLEGCCISEKKPLPFHLQLISPFFFSNDLTSRSPPPSPPSAPQVCPHSTVTRRKETGFVGYCGYRLHYSTQRDTEKRRR
jgi:hypothetical protein